MLINCQNCQKIVSSYREVCPHCNKKSFKKAEKSFLWRFAKILFDRNWNEKSVLDREKVMF